MPTTNRAEQERYWAERAERILQAAEKSADEITAGMRRAWSDAERTIGKEIQAFYGRYAAETGLSIAEVRQRLSPAALRAAKEDIARYYEEAERLGLDPRYRTYLRGLSARAYMSRLEELKLNYRREIEKLAGEQQSLFTQRLTGTYEDSYYRTAYELHRGAGIVGSFTILNATRVERVVRERWLGGNYSDRIWTNKDKLVEALDVLIPRGMALGKNPRAIARELNKTMQTGIKNATRLARTEFMHTANRSRLDALKARGAKQYKIMAAVDERTCEICGSLHGAVFDVDDAIDGVTLPPYHPNCRCIIVKYFPPGDLDEMYEDAQTLTYDEWRMKYVDNPAQMRYNTFVADVHALIAKEYPLSLNARHQNRHIEGTPEFDPTRSTLTADPIALISRYAGKSEPVRANSGAWAGKERFSHTRIIGVYRDLTGVERLTANGVIHYSRRRGAHVVPGKPDGS